MSAHLTLADALATATQQMSTRRPLGEVLQNLVNMAQRSLPGVDHADISLTHADGSMDTIAATDDLVLELDALQYELAEGPCLTAIRDEGVVLRSHWARPASRRTSCRR